MSTDVVEDVFVEPRLDSKLPSASQPPSEELLQVAGTCQPKTAANGDYRGFSRGGYLSSSHPRRISVEHNYGKLIPSRGTRGSGGRDSSFSTVVLFSDRIKKKLKKRRKLLKSVGVTTGLEEQDASVENPGRVSNGEGDSTLTPAVLPSAVSEVDSMGDVEAVGGEDVSRLGHMISFWIFLISGIRN